MHTYWALCSSMHTNYSHVRALIISALSTGTRVHKLMQLYTYTYYDMNTKSQIHTDDMHAYSYQIN